MSTNKDRYGIKTWLHRNYVESMYGDGRNNTIDLIVRFHVAERERRGTRGATTYRSQVTPDPFPCE